MGRSQGRAALLGALWGFGHSTGQLILGLLMVVLKDRFDAFVPVRYPSPWPAFCRASAQLQEVSFLHMH